MKENSNLCIYCLLKHYVTPSVNNNLVLCRRLNDVDKVKVTDVTLRDLGIVVNNR